MAISSYSLNAKMIIWMGLLLFFCSSCASSSSSSVLTAFSSSNGNYDGHTWSPDGGWLVAESGVSMKLFLFSSQGQLVHTLQLDCELGTGNEDFSWLPDGRISCLNANDPNQTLDIFSINQKGEATLSSTVNTPLVPSTFVYALQWNPHQNWLAIFADKVPGQTAPFLYLTDLESRNLIVPLSMNAETLAWSPDGTMLALTKRDGTIVLLKVQQSKSEMVSATIVRQLDVGAGTIGNLAWSPSGRWLLCRHVSYDSEDYLFLIATDGSGKQIKLTSSTTDGQLDYPAWSPDGKRLIVSHIAQSGNTLMSLDIATLLKKKGVTP